MIPRKPPRSFFEHLWEALEDETVRILVFSSVVSFCFALFLSPPESRRSDLIQAMAIVVAVVVVGGVNSFQNWSKDKEFQSLTALSADRQCTVRRNAQDVSVSAYEVVVGDIVVMESGDFISCDGVLVKGSGIVVDESSVTGESAPVEKGCPDSPTGKFDALLQSGTFVKDGSGFMLVTHVGKSSKMGKLHEQIENAEMEETPLQERLDEMAGQIGKVGMAAGLLTFAVLSILRVWAQRSSNFFSLDTYISPSHYSNQPLLMDFLNYLITGIAIVVVAVPEGLPLAVTIALAFSMRKMMKDQCMVKTMKSCETMGSATFICTDKTGTLTENKMTVVKVSTPFLTTDGEFDAVELKKVLMGGGKHAPENAPYCWRLRDAICLTSTAGEYNPGGPESKGELLIKGNPTEYALVAFSDSLQNDPSKKHSALRTRPSLKAIARAPFSKETKFQSAVIHDEAEKETFCYVIGAPEVVLEFCVGDAKGDEPERVGTVASWRKSKGKIVSEFGGGEGLRVLAVAYRILPAGSENQPAQKLLSSAKENLGLLGLFGIKDPLRPDVIAAIKDCQSAGIKIMMMTGDHEDTAKAIALQAGILRDADLLRGGVCMEGKAFRELCAKPNPTIGGKEEEEEVEEEEGKAGEISVATPSTYISLAARAAAKNIRVMSRCSPDDKYLMVCALQREKEVVAVTGDGTNDALALRKADVGLAMGIAGTAVAKEASDIVILDDNFSSIVKAVAWGRGIKENIRKFLSFQLTINIVALTLTFFAACTSGGKTHELPLQPVQLLWVNLIMDSFAALALATEPPTPRLLQQKPQARDAPLITPLMFANMFGHAFLQIAVLLVLTQVPSSALLFQLQPHEMGNIQHDTIVFTVFVALQVGGGALSILYDLPHFL